MFGQTEEHIAHLPPKQQNIKDTQILSELLFVEKQKNIEHYNLNERIKKLLNNN